MKEEFLHYVWRYRLYAATNLRTTSNEDISVITPGVYNTNSGPDFMQCEVYINNQKWVGNVEIHVNASDWYAHGHEQDSHYDAVILHVVWNYDIDIYVKNNHPIPTLELKSYVDARLLSSYRQLQMNQGRWIPCENQIQDTSLFTMKHWLERLFFERLERKTVLVRALLEASKNDWEFVLFQMIAKSFGSQVNGHAFLSLAQSIPIAVLRREWHDPMRLSALLFGQSGLLKRAIEDEHYIQLTKEYAYLQHKYALTEIHEPLQFFRMRPHNFPTIRIAQLVGLYSSRKSVFSSAMEFNTTTELYAFFDVEVEAYWKTHFTFGKKSKKSTKKLTRSFMDLLILNALLPVKFYYQRSMGVLREGELIALMSSLKSEKNNVLGKFSDLGVVAENALEGQALLELKKHYCESKRCLDCAIGKNILDDASVQ